MWLLQPFLSPLLLSYALKKQVNSDERENYTLRLPKKEENKRNFKIQKLTTECDSCSLSFLSCLYPTLSKNTMRGNYTLELPKKYKYN